MRKFFCGLVTLGAVAAMAAVFVSSAGAYGGGATHDTWHLGPAQPNDPNFGMPGAQDFYIDGNVVTSSFHGTTTTTTDDPEFLGDTNIPAEPGHYAFHPAPGVSGNIQVAFRPAR